jgi:uncharacterized membrane protein
MSTPPDQPPQIWSAVPNRSLGPQARTACLAALAAAPIALGSVAAVFLGAWPVLPFAGLEVAVLAYAFHRIACHDGDYERLEIAGRRVRIEARSGERVVSFEGHAPWARLVVRDRPGRCELQLRYAGKSVDIGRMLTDERRRLWAAELGRRMPVTEQGR